MIAKGIDYFITGTQIFGPATGDSDLDIVVTPKLASELESLLRYNDISITRIGHTFADYPGFYFMLTDSLKINIVVLDSEVQFTAWERATRIMRKRSPIPDRKERIRTFKMLCEGGVL